MCYFLGYKYYDNGARLVERRVSPLYSNNFVLSLITKIGRERHLSHRRHQTRVLRNSSASR